MSKNTIGLAVIAVVAVGGVAAYAYWPAKPAVVAQARGPQGPRVIPVEVAPAVKKVTPITIEALGTVTPMASVAVKSRLETEIIGVHFPDGSRVKAGDLLFTLDSRVIEAQIQQAEGQLARDTAQLEGAERDVRRYTELVAKNATPTTNLDNARTQADIFRAAIKADEAQIKNLRVQLSFCSIRAPISGRIGTAGAKVGNFVRPADTAPLATIIQTAPVYVSFTVPQRSLPDVREAMAAEGATIEASIPGESRRASGTVAVIENTVDAATGMATVRAIMPNKDELLWPGTLVSAKLTLRTEEAVVVPSASVQIGQGGSFVYVVKNGTATVQPVKVSRAAGNETVIGEGLAGGETIVTDGHLLLTNGARIAPRERKAGA